MKTLERWPALPRRALFVSIPTLRPSYTHYIQCYVIWCCDVIAWCHLTLWYRGVTSYDVLTCETSWQRNCTNSNPSETLKFTFSGWRPWPFTHDLDIQTHPRYCQGQCLHRILGPSNGSAVRAFTDTHTGPIPYPRPLMPEGMTDRLADYRVRSSQLLYFLLLPHDKDQAVQLTLSHLG